MLAHARRIKGTPPFTVPSRSEVALVDKSTFLRDEAIKFTVESTVLSKINTR
jgi:hypothetical protein